MALMWLAAAWQKKHAKNTKLVVLTVNHNLRKTAAAEAELVLKTAQQLGISAHILEWKHKKIEKGVEEQARIARYKLMSDFCKAHKIKHLLVAHHQDDDAETLLMNLSRGSGLYGLSGIAASSEQGGILVLRPLLSFTKKELLEVCKKNKIAWANDESNDDEKFLRVRIRKFMPELKKIDLTPTKLAYAAGELKRARTAIEFFIKKARQTYVKTKNDGFIIAPSIFKNYPSEVSLRLLAKLLQEVGKTAYPPRLENLKSLAATLAEPSFKPKTLNHTKISQTKDGLILIYPEAQKS